MTTEADKVLAEALGWTEIKECEGIWFGWIPEMPRPMPPAPHDVGFVLDYRAAIPAYSTDDAAALEGIKVLRSKGFDVAIVLSCTNITAVKICKPVWRETVAEGNPAISKLEHDQYIAAAFTDAMVGELCQYPGDPIRAGICRGSRSECGSCKDGVISLLPEIKKLLKEMK